MMVVNDRHTKSPMSSGTSQNLKSRRSPQHLEAASVKILPRRVRIVKLGEPCSAGHYSSLNVAERPASVSVLAGIYKHAISIIEIRRIENEALTFLCKSVLGDPTQPLLIMPNMGNYSVGLPTEVLRSPSIYPHIPQGVLKTFRVLAPWIQHLRCAYLTSPHICYLMLPLATKSLCRLSDTS